MTECPACQEMLFPIHIRCKRARYERDANRWRRVEGYVQAGTDQALADERFERRVRVELAVEEMVPAALN